MLVQRFQIDGEMMMPTGQYYCLTCKRAASSAVAPTPRLKKFGDLLAMNWDATEDGAYELLDFLRDVPSRINDDATVYFQNDGAEWVEAEPSRWIVKRSRHHFDVLTGKALLAELQGES